MARNGKQIADLRINGHAYSIRATQHGLERMEERNVEAHAVAGTVLALGPDRLLALQEAQEEAIIIDEAQEISVVIGFKKNTIRIITVIDKARVFVKKNTRVENI